MIVSFLCSHHLHPPLSHPSSRTQPIQSSTSFLFQISTETLEKSLLITRSIVLFDQISRVSFKFLQLFSSHHL
ncbi:hypothetical protein L6452_27610 [Arctium lappa]|uniref:Uncharacterized protein n=1 Tax=Arctium lappa TaxID=4217 RepID=A0ACB8ZWC1_ARCLA|nr:hypothetical protein L6452_27610 [Arctium lappa]